MFFNNDNSDHSTSGIDADLQTVESQLSPGPNSSSLTPGQAVFQSIRSALGNIRDRMHEQSASPSLWDRFHQAERSHEHRIPLPIVQRAGSGSTPMVDRSTPNRPRRPSTLVASRRPDSPSDRDLHEITTSLHRGENEDAEPMEGIEVIFEQSQGKGAVAVGNSHAPTEYPSTPPPVLLSKRSRSNLDKAQEAVLFPPTTPQTPVRTVPTTKPTLYTWGEGAQSAASIRTVTSCAANDHHVACATAAGQVWTVGRNSAGEVPSPATLTTPGRVDIAQAHVTDVSCGYDHTAALRSNGAVLTWGGNEHGQLGHRRNSDTNAFFCPPAIMAVPGKVTRVVCGDGFTLALTSRMEVWACGVLVASSNANNTTTLQRVLHPLPIVGVAAGRRHAVLLSSHGSAFVWGDNSMGACGQQVPKYLNVPVPVKLGIATEVSLPRPLVGWTQQEQSGCDSAASPCAEPIAIPERIVAAACGNDHTVLVSHTGSLFVFGRNMEGQLGVKDDIVYKPQRVSHPEQGRFFVNADAGGAHTVLLDDMGVVWQLGGDSGRHFKRLSLPGIVIESIAAGGDNTLAIAAVTEDNAARSDHPDPTSSSSCENNQQLSECLEELVHEISLKAGKDTADTGMAATKVASRTEELFRTPSVLNSLFLDPTELEELFAKLFSIRVPGFQKVIASAIEHGMHQGLETVQPDETSSHLKWPEQVRFLLLLIQCPLFINWKMGDDNKFDRRGDLILALCECILGLPYEGYRALMAWATSVYPRELFVRFLIQPLLHQLGKCIAVDAGAERRPLRSIVAVLKWLYTASERVEGSALSEDYYCDAIGSMNAEILFRDLHRYKNASAQQKKADFFFAANSFLLSPSTKRNLLHIENEVSMMQSATSGMTYNMLAGAFQFRPYFILEVDRQSLLQQTLGLVAHADSSDLQKKLRVVFRGEEGVDAGGVTREFFQLLTSQLFDINTGMWSTNHSDSTVTWFNGDCFWNDEGYYLSGVLVGLAVYNSALLDVSFPQAVYRKLLGLPLGLEDMVDESVREGLRKLLEYDGDDVEDVFCLSFDVNWMDLGVQKKKELKPNGSNIPVTSSNKEEYVKLYVQWSLVDSVYAQFQSFESGFMKVMENSSLELLRAEELELLVVGTPELDFDALEANTDYDGGYSKDSVVVQNFWKFVKEAPRSQQLNLLKFTTGSTKAPIGGLGNMNFKIQRAGPDSINLPTTHTCFNTLLLPDYGDNYEKLESLLGRAIVECEGFGLQ